MRFCCRFLFASETVDESTRASAFYQRQSFGETLLASEQTDPQQLLVWNELVGKECRFEFFAGQRRAQFFSDSNRLSKVLLGSFRVAFANRDESETGVTAFCDLRLTVTNGIFNRGRENLF